MWMRYRGGGVGHTSTLQQTKILEEEMLGLKKQDNMEIDSDSDSEDDEVSQLSDTIDEAEKEEINEEEIEDDRYSDEDRDPSDWDKNDDEGYN
jgi:hypothetical protein